MGPNLVACIPMKNIKTDPKIIARRGIDSISSKVLEATYKAYPQKTSVKSLAKSLKIREKSVLLALRKINSNGVPIEIVISAKNDKEIIANMKEPIYWIIKEKESAEKMLEMLNEQTLNTDDEPSKKKNINQRIYREYVNSLNELFDKWISLKLLEQLEETTDN